MNPEPPNPRAELEARVTAFLLGELPAHEAAALRQEMDDDAQLAALCDRLKPALKLLREAAAHPETPSAETTPLKLADDRRQKLLAQFKTIQPREFAPAHKRSFTRFLVELAACLLVLGILAAVVTPKFGGISSTARTKAVEMNLRQLDVVKQKWAQDNHKSANDTVTAEDLKPYYEGVYNGLPPAIVGETYVPGKVGEPAVAEVDSSKAKHAFGRLPSEKPPTGARQELVELDSNGKLAYAAPASTQLAYAGAQRNLRAAESQTTPKAILAAADVQTASGAANFKLGEVPRPAAALPPIAPSAAAPIAAPTPPAQLTIVLPPANQLADASGIVPQNVPQGVGFSAGETPSLRGGFGGGGGGIGGRRKDAADQEKIPAQTLNTVQLGLPPPQSAGSPQVSFGVQNGRIADSLDLAAGDKPLLPPPGQAGIQNYNNAGSLKSDGSVLNLQPTTPMATVNGGAAASTLGNPASSAGKVPLLADTPATGNLFRAPAPQQPASATFDRVAGRNSPEAGSAQQLQLAQNEPFKASFSAGEVTANGAVSADRDTHSLLIMTDPATYGQISNVVANLDQTKNAPPAAATPLETRATTLVQQQNSNPSIAGAVTPFGGPVASAPAARPMPQQLAQAKAAPSGKKVADKSVAEQDDVAIRKPAAPAPEPQPEVLTSANAFSTFSLNVSDVSFKLAAATLEKGLLPEPASIRSEEFLNAFDYRDPAPAPGAPIGFAWERAQDPFAQNRELVRFSVKTAAAGREPGRPLNLVLLLDNSGSMVRADRVQIIHEALRVLAGQLQPQDKLSVVIFARTATLWIDGVSGSQGAAIAQAVGGLTPQGGTNLEDAMKLAYETARRHYLANGVNRVVLLTDGAANLGNVDPSALQLRVEENRRQGIALDCFGIGWEGYNDDLLEVLTRHGDGRYGFLNTPAEAATDFAGQLAGALHVAAADVKVQVEFNPARVTAYRQIGYAKHQLTKEQFRDNTVDAAQIGAAESGNGLYVVAVNPAGSGPLGTVRVRFKVPGTSEVQEHAWELPYTGKSVRLEQASPAMRLAATSSAFAEWLSGIPYAAEVTPDQLLGYLSGVPQIYGADARPQKLEWMIRQAKSISGK